jgi:hypothetical protein
MLERIDTQIHTTHVNRVRIIVEQSDQVTWELEAVPVDSDGVVAGGQMGRREGEYDLAAFSLAELYRSLNERPEFVFFLRGGEMRLRLVDERGDIR